MRVRRDGYVTRPRARFSLGARVGLALTLAAVAWISVVATSQRAPDELAANAVMSTTEPVTRPAGEAVTVSRSARGPLPTVFASADGMNLTLPSPQAVALSFHDAGNAEALALIPTHAVGAAAATNAVDVIVSPGGGIRAPVGGRVVEVADYPMSPKSGSTRDWRVLIEPGHRSDLHVVVTHLREPAVAAGDRVDAGVTVLGLARALPGSDLETHRRPHAHVEVTAALPPGPIDPNATALPAGD